LACELFFAIGGVLVHAVSVPTHDGGMKAPQRAPPIRSLEVNVSWKAECAQRRLPSSVEDGNACQLTALIRAVQSSTPNAHAYNKTKDIAQT
jgi:hypothetical protein